MKTFVLCLIVAVATITVGIGLAYAIRETVGFHPEVMLTTVALLLMAASGLLVLGRSMDDSFYQKGDRKGAEGHGSQSRDIGHLPGRSHLTFVGHIGHGLAASIGNLSILRRARVGGHLQV